MCGQRGCCGELPVRQQVSQRSGRKGRIARPCDDRRSHEADDCRRRLLGRRFAERRHGQDRGARTSGAELHRVATLDLPSAGRNSGRRRGLSMLISRRAFTGGALSLTLGGQLAAPALAQDSTLDTALAAIRSYGEAHLAYFSLPGMTLGLTTPQGLNTVLNFGFANRDSRTPIAPETLFQIGSISKSMVAALIHLQAAEGRFRFTDRISDLLPMVPLPKSNAITVQHILDHTGGLPDGPPIFAQGGLWTGFAPGEHWSYSNTGYAILGKLAEHAGSKPLDQLLASRILSPLGMGLSRGAIVGADRPRYAQGYERLTQPFRSPAAFRSRPPHGST